MQKEERIEIESTMQSDLLNTEIHFKKLGVIPKRKNLILIETQPNIHYLHSLKESCAYNSKDNCMAIFRNKVEKLLLHVLK